MFLFSVCLMFYKPRRGEMFVAIYRRSKSFELRRSDISIKWHLQLCRLSEAQRIVIHFFCKHSAALRLRQLLPASWELAPHLNIIRFAAGNLAFSLSPFFVLHSPVYLFPYTIYLLFQRTTYHQQPTALLSSFTLSSVFSEIPGLR